MAFQPPPPHLPREYFMVQFLTPNFFFMFYPAKIKPLKFIHLNFAMLPFNFNCLATGLYFISFQLLKAYLAFISCSKVSQIWNWPWWPRGLECASYSSRCSLEALVQIPLKVCVFLYGTVMDLLYIHYWRNIVSIPQSQKWPKSRARPRASQ